VRHASGELSFEGFDRFSDAIAGFLRRRGINAGDRVALFCINSERFALAYFGILKCGATVVPINLLLNPREIAYILEDAGASALLYHDALAEVVTALPLPPCVSWCASVGNGTAAADHPGWDDMTAATDRCPEPDYDPRRQLAAILYTSGTTGRPKGAMLSHHNLVSNVECAMQVIRLQPGEDVMLVVLPMFHAFAATVGMLMPLFSGCCLIPLARFDPQAVADTVARERVTVLPMVPSMFQLMLRLPQEEAGKLASLRFCISGAAAMPPPVMQAFEQRYGCLIYEGDGPTECSPVTCVNPIAGLRKPASVGPSIPGVEMRILDEQGEELPNGEIGEICVRGPNVMLGYWKRTQDTRAAFFGEWFRTGDLGHRDDDGYFYIVDRLKDLVIVNGMNVYPRVVEEVLQQFEPVAETAVVGEPHGLHGEIPVAFVALKPGQRASADSIRRHCRDHLGRHEVPRKIFIVDALPRNAAGKVLKRELRKQGELERGIDSRQPET
jgi:long-chain acyl-CoA synthetase